MSQSRLEDSHQAHSALERLSLHTLGSLVKGYPQFSAFASFQGHLSLVTLNMSLMVSKILRICLFLLLLLLLQQKHQSTGNL